MTVIDNASPIERGKRARRLRNLANLDRRQTCESGNFTIPTLKNWELGRYGGIKEQGAKKLLDVMKNNGVDASYNWLMFGEGSSPTISVSFEEIKKSINIKKQKNFLDKEEQQILYEISIFKDFYKNIAHFYITDNSLSPIYQSGDYVAGFKVFPENINIETEKYFNLNCIVEINTGEIFIKELKTVKPNQKYYFYSINGEKNLKPTIFTASEISYIAPISRHYKKDIYL